MRKKKNIFDAVRARELPGVNKFINKGVDVNIQDENGWTPLHIACEKGCKDIVMHLIANKANVSARHHHRVGVLAE